MPPTSKVRLLGPALAVLMIAACSTGAPTVPSGTGPVTTAAGTGASASGPTSASATASDTPSGSLSSPSASAPTASGSATLAVHRNADGTCTMPARYAGHDFETMPTGSARKSIALTFDGGASDAGDAEILRVLQEKDATATFFFTGKFAELYPDMVRTIAARYPIGNHSYDHPYFTTLSDARVAQEIAQAEAAIRRASGGVSPAPLFRFPFGDVNAPGVALVNKACYVPFRWTIDTLGYNGTSGGNSVAKILALVDRLASPSGVILMHQGDNPTDHTTLDADALAQMIDNLRAKGYELVTLEESLHA